MNNKSKMITTHPYFIEIEIGTYCNRVCSWCPNGWDTRGGRKNAISENLWRKIILDLQKENYSGWLAFHNYNEPLADPTIYEKIGFVNKYLPGTKTAIYTNGDYLNKNSVAKLLELKVKEIRITMYPQRNQIFTQQSDTRIHNLISRLNIPLNVPDIIDGKRGRETKFKANETIFHLIVPDIKDYTDRAGKVQLQELKLRIPRQHACYLPSLSAAIDYKGNMKLCCQIYDVESSEYSEYNIGNLAEAGFWDLWNSEKMKDYRHKARLGEFGSMSICKFCSHSSSPEQSQIIKELK